MSAKIMLNGVEYDGIDAMPPDVRKDYEAVLESLKNTGGEEVLSLLERGDRSSTKAPLPAQPARPVAPARPSRPVPRPAPVVEDRRGRGQGGRGWLGGLLRILFWMALGALVALWAVRRWHLLV